MAEKQKQPAQEPTKLYRITHGKYHRTENGALKTYRAGSKVELTRDEALSMKSQVERAHPSLDEDLEQPGSTSAPPASATPSAFDYLADLSENDAIVVINGLGTAEEVQSAIEAEHKGMNRPAVIKAAQDRIA